MSMNTVSSALRHATLWLVATTAIILAGATGAHLVSDYSQAQFPARSTVAPQTSLDAAYTQLEKLGAEGITIVVTDGPENCSLWVRGPFNVRYPAKFENGERVENGGCWQEATPNSIYLSSQLGGGDTLNYVVTHEYAHVLQGRGEVPDSGREVAPSLSQVEAIECIADVEAYRFGIPESSLSYFESGKCEDFRSMLDEIEAGT